jgi:hypothetical protein
MSDLARKVFALFGKPELLTTSEGKPTQEQPRTAPSWQCPECSGSVQLEPPDEHAPTRFWTCTQCGTRGATREGASFPVVWMSTRMVQ